MKLPEYYQGRSKVITNYFRTHKKGLNFIIVKASMNLRICPSQIQYDVLIAE